MRFMMMIDYSLSKDKRFYVKNGTFVLKTNNKYNATTYTLLYFFATYDTTYRM